MRLKGESIPFLGPLQMLGLVLGLVLVPAAGAAGSAPSRLWSRKLPGFITDLAISEGAAGIFFSTIPDFERDSGQRDFRVWRYNAKGRKLWEKKTSGQVKSLALSKDGSLGVYAEYNDELTALDARGRKLWSAHGPCRPVLLDRVKKVLCYHDDDAEPKIAYEVLDWKTGKRLGSFPIETDVLALKVSRDGHAFALVLTGRSGKGARVLVIGARSLKPLYELSVDAQVVDVALSSGELPGLALLSNLPDLKQRVSVYEPAGEGKSAPRQSGEASFSQRIEQIELSDDGSRVFAYGNTAAQGQQLVAFGKRDSGWGELWREKSPRVSEYSSSFILSGGNVILGLEDIGAKTRVSRFLGFDLLGKKHWDIPVTLEEGSYLYTQAYSPANGLLAVATDDAHLALYRTRN